MGLHQTCFKPSYGYSIADSALVVILSHGGGGESISLSSSCICWDPQGRQALHHLELRALSCWPVNSCPTVPASGVALCFAPHLDPLLASAPSLGWPLAHITVTVPLSTERGAVWGWAGVQGPQVVWVGHPGSGPWGFPA